MAREGLPYAAKADGLLAHSTPPARSRLEIAAFDHAYRCPHQGEGEGTACHECPPGDLAAQEVRVARHQPEHAVGAYAPDQERQQPIENQDRASQDRLVELAEGD